MPPSGVKESCDRIDCAATGIGGDGGEERGLRDAEAHLLAFHIAAGVDQRGLLVDAMQQWVRLRFCPVTDGVSGDKQNGHCGKHRPTVSGRAGHLAQGDGQGGRNQKDQFDLDKVAEGRGIFEWVCAVGVEKATAVGAQFLDHFLGSHRTLGDHLGGCPCCSVVTEV